MGRYQDFDDYGDYREPRRRREPGRRSRAVVYDDYDAPPRRARGRRPPADARARSRRSRQPERRGVSPAVVIGLLANVLILGTLGVLYFGFPATFARLLHLTPATPSLAAGADTVLLAHSVPWGTLALDDNGAAAQPTVGATPQATGTTQPSPTAVPTGTAQATPQATTTPQTASALQPAGTADGRPYFRLPRGTHTLVYTAAPFAPVRCQLSVPPASGDTCPLLPVAASDATRPLGAARMVDAQATVDKLPADQQKSLFAAIGAALTAQPVSVQPNEHYVNDAGQVAITFQTLQATLLYDVNTDPAHAVALPTPATSASAGAATTPQATAAASPAATSAATPSGTPSATPAQPATCLSLCDTTLPADAPTDAWNQLANLVPAWRYATSTGRAVAAHAPGAVGGANTTLLVNIRWNGQWQAGAKDADKAALLAGTAAGLVKGVHLPDGWSFRATPATNPADGYLIIAGKSDPTSGAPSGTTAQVLYRFGVLVAANPTAQTTFPTMLRATTAERQLATQLAAQQP